MKTGYLKNIGKKLKSLGLGAKASRTEKKATCPPVKGWKEDDFAKFVSAHRAKVHAMVCRADAYKGESFCSRGRR